MISFCVIIVPVVNYQNGVAEYECIDGYWYEPGVFSRSRECTDSVWEDWQNVTDCYGRYSHAFVSYTLHMGIRFVRGILCVCCKLHDCARHSFHDFVQW